MCDLTTRACSGCGSDSDCASGQVCLDAARDGACGGLGQNCTCVAGSCHEPKASNAGDCAGACCNFACSIGGDCCGDGDCTAPNFGNASACTSAALAPVQVCNGASCGCPAPLAGQIYVDVSLGSDTAGNGSPACPVRSIGKGLSLASSASVFIRPGIYDAAVETFPLVPLANTTLAADPTCAGGSVVVQRNDGNTTACPLQRTSGAQVSCAIAIAASNIHLRDLIWKNDSGRAIVFGSGADAQSSLDSGSVGCEGAGCTKNGDADLAFVGTASPVIGPPSNATSLVLSGSHTNAIDAVDQAAPLIRNLQDLFGFDGDVVRIEDAAAPSLNNVPIDWTTQSGSNAGFGVNVSGSGPAVIFSGVRVYGAGQGGVRFSRQTTGSAHNAIEAMRVERCAGNPNNGLGFGLLLDSPTGTSSFDISNSVFDDNSGDGITINNAVVAISNSDSSFNGRYFGTGCAGGNGVTVSSGNANVAINAATVFSNHGATNTACVTGNGIRAAQGVVNVQGSTIVGNDFDGIHAEFLLGSLRITGSQMTANQGSGVDLVQTGAAFLSGNNFTCDSGGGAGNGIANLCLYTPFFGATLAAPGNEWLIDPPVPASQSASFTNLFCSFARGADIAIVKPVLFGTSSVSTNPTATGLTCP